MPPPCFHGFIFPDHTLSSWIDDGVVGENAGGGKDSTLRGENSSWELMRIDRKVRMASEAQSSRFKFEGEMSSGYAGLWSARERGLSLGPFAVRI